MWGRVMVVVIGVIRVKIRGVLWLHFGVRIIVEM